MSEINHVYGDILKSTADMIVIPVNTFGVAGAGLARHWATHYPGLAYAYRQACKHPLHYFPEKLSAEQVVPIYFKNTVFLMFATKQDYQEPSKYSYIHGGLKSLIAYLDDGRAKVN